MPSDDPHTIPHPIGAGTLEEIEREAILRCDETAPSYDFGVDEKMMLDTHGFYA